MKYEEKSILLDDRTLKSVINNATAHRRTDRFEKIGTECLSPIVIGYAYG